LWIANPMNVPVGSYYYSYSNPYQFPSMTSSTLFGSGQGWTLSEFEVYKIT